MAHSLRQIGHLVPLSKTLVENTSSPKIPLSEGPNVIGRNTVSLPDKRLSRKHITLTASADGSASLLVEGTNPVVVNAGNERMRVGSGEKVDICPGCVIELIPGHHFFVYEVLSGDPSGSSGVGKNNGVHAIEDRSRKRMRKDVEDQSFMWDSQSQASGGHSDVEGIRNFHVPEELLPCTFRLLRVQGLPAWANTSCVSIEDVVKGDIIVAILSNYMVDIDWLIPACPILAKVPHVLVIHGEGDGTLDHMKRKKPANWVLHKPPLPISYGTHHSKAMLLVYPTGVRIIVHTANLIYVDWNNKSQGLWMQDFPWKDPSNASKGCGFEDDLVDYLSALKWPQFNINVPAVGNFTINPSFFKKFDYRDSAVRLIASVPGYHTGSNLKKWGHMKLRSVLQESTFDKDFQKSPLVYQFSSLGSLDEKWMAELASSMSSGFSEDKVPLGLGDPLIIWPTVEDVRCSLEGYAAGNAIPSPLKNVEKEFLKKYWANWKATHTGRCRAMPHIKTYTRYKGQKLAWLLLTSANLSKAAWGALQKNNSQLMIRSYELGVLFLPSSIRRRGRIFSCTNKGVPSEDVSASSHNSEVRRAKLVTLAWQRSLDKDSSHDIIPLPVPYELPPQSYSQEDVPWSWDRRYTKKDVYGQVWPRQVQLYAYQES
ncbi:tyrosyl-DNA phosphodiesterase 1 isoform X2 [Rhodamnia argentea]|uniref:Tyrosyl-DNA phosphodiesterase 1 isoform X2 n=1 Tax=Rhodamnia argentea TaxID=178133 RepID=A0A8B8PGU5_9MYRT|nr:tyrosyl-DNA phosphodiesterase 1 isoform X2 [Rhodamnia argentea]